MDRITKSLLREYVSSNEFESLDTATSFEYFVSYSIASKLYRSSFEVSELSTGGGGDGGLDSIFFIVNGKLITKVDELSDIASSSHYLDVDIIFIQAKTSSDFDGQAISSFFDSIKYFIRDIGSSTYNSKVKALHELWIEILDNSNMMVNRTPNCYAFYVTTGRWVGDEELNRISEEKKYDIENEGVFNSINFEMFGAKEIQKIYQETKNKLSVQINFQNKITLPDINGISEAHLGVISFNDFKKIIQDENDNIYNIFYDNVRDFQGFNKVNNQIRKTLEDKNFDLFCVLNNGVTIVASTLISTGNRFTIQDYQIVNGCQTSNVLHSCRHIENIDQLFVPIKLIVTENEDIKTNITLANNSQTEVKVEHLESLSNFHKDLEMYFESENEDVKLYFERRSMQFNSDTTIKKTQIISIPVLIKSFASMFLVSPHLVNGYYGTIANKFSDKIFISNHKLEPYYVSGLCFYRIEQYFRATDIRPENKKGRYFILMIVRLLIFGEKIPFFNSNQMMKKSNLLISILKDDILSLRVMRIAENIFEDANLDFDKRQFKSESDTSEVIESYKSFIKNTDNKSEIQDIIDIV